MRTIDEIYRAVVRTRGTAHVEYINTRTLVRGFAVLARIRHHPKLADAPQSGKATDALRVNYWMGLHAASALDHIRAVLDAAEYNPEECCNESWEPWTRRDAAYAVAHMFKAATPSSEPYASWVFKAIDSGKPLPWSIPTEAKIERLNRIERYRND